MKRNTKSMKRLDVLYAAEGSSLNSNDGSAVHVEEVTKILVKRGFGVTLVARGKRVPRNLDCKGLVVISLPDWDFPLSISTYVISFLVIGLRALLQRPALIYQRDSGMNVGIITAKLLRISALLEVNGDIMQDDPVLSRGIGALLKPIVRIAYSSASVVTTPTSKLLPILWSYGAKRTESFVVPNAVDCNVFYPMDRNTCRRKLGLDSSSVYFCFVGNLAPWQGLEKALLAFSKFTEETQDINAKLIIIGDGSLKIRLQQLTRNLHLEKRVIFTDRVDHNVVPVYINASDVCLAPFTSKRNARIGVSPLKIFEYLSCGKPVIASAIPGTELIKRMDAGILVKPDDSEDLKDAFEKAIGKLEFWKSRAHVVHIEMARNQSWNARVDTILRIMLDSPARRRS